jgi:hypothetical protein
VYVSVSDTTVESIFATHNLDKVLYSAGRMKAAKLKAKAPKYLILISRNCYDTSNNLPVSSPGQLMSPAFVSMMTFDFLLRDLVFNFWRVFDHSVANSISIGPVHGPQQQRPTFYVDSTLRLSTLMQLIAKRGKVWRGWILFGLYDPAVWDLSPCHPRLSGQM